MRKFTVALTISFLLLTGCGAQGEDLTAGQKSGGTVKNHPVCIGEIIVKEGYILRRDIIPQLSQLFELSHKEVKAALEKAGKETVFYGSSQDYRSFEGVLLPGKYQVFEGVLIDPFLDNCLEDFNKTIRAISTQENNKNKLSLKSQIVLASIVQAECLEGEYLEETSTVFQNRILAKRRLQSCVTAEYALEYQRPFLTADDIKIKSPYNTYYAKGLPPGPICSFGVDSLKAAMATKMNSENLYFYYDYLIGEMHFYDEYTQFRKDAGQAFKAFEQQAGIGPRDKINKQERYGKQSVPH